MIDAHLEKRTNKMKPKLNKLITLMLLLGTFAFLMEAEERVSSMANKELSKWASLLPVNTTSTPKDSLTQESKGFFILNSLALDESEKVKSANN